MKKLNISEPQRIVIYNEVDLLTPNFDIYFTDHVRIVARNCFIYAKHLSESEKKIDPTICELGGLLHDIGYTKEFEPEEKDHILKGIKMAPEILKKINIEEYYIEKIVDTIWTHDGNLNRSRYIEAPTNNKIVNDVDAMQFFDWPLPSLIEFSLRLRPNRRIEEIVEGILEHTNQTFNYISLPYFRELAEPKYEARKKELERTVNNQNGIKRR